MFCLCFSDVSSPAGAEHPSDKDPPAVELLTFGANADDPADCDPANAEGLKRTSDAGMKWFEIYFLGY